MLQVPMRPKPDSPPPTDEQFHIIDLIRFQDNNLQINALAGTGKTTTLEMVQSASKRQPALCLAFNRRIADEMERRFPSSTTVRTFNGCGHRAWQKQVGNLKVDDKKMGTLLKQETEGFKGDDKKAVREAFLDILKAVSLAKSLGYVPEGKFPTARRLITKDALHASLETRPGPLEASLIDS